MEPRLRSLLGTATSAGKTGFMKVARPGKRVSVVSTENLRTAWVVVAPMNAERPLMWVIPV
jgi:phage baseplate assembly protein gpV